MKKLLSGVRTPTNIFSQIVNKDENKILMEIPADGSYIDILGHRLDGFDSFESFVEYLKKVAAIEKENEQLKKEIREMKNEKANFIRYLEERLEESKILRVYDTEFKVTYTSKDEQIYQKVLDKMKEEV